MGVQLTNKERQRRHELRIFSFTVCLSVLNMIRIHALAISLHPAARERRARLHIS